MAVDTQRKKRGDQAAAIPLVPFTAAAHEHVEPAVDVSSVLSAATQQKGPFDIPAYGYLRHVWLLLELSGGTGGTLAADGPWNAIQEIALLDVNGAPIYGPVGGYDLFLTHLLGGYAFNSDPRLYPDYSATPGAFVVAVRLPVEINHNDGLGALANQNAAAAYKLRFTLNGTAAIWSAVPTGTLTLRVRAFAECWSQPTPNDMAGRPQAQVPPRHGTTQYWSKFTRQLSAGNNVIVLPRVGNLIRQIIAVARDGGGARLSTVMADPIIINWDARQLLNEPRALRRSYGIERGTPLHADGFPAGVFPFSFASDMLGHNGDGTPELYLPTVQSTRLEITGSNFAAGTLDVLTCDVAPVEVNPAERYEEQSETGFRPEVGGTVKAV